MKQNFLKMAGLASIVMLLQSPVQAQDNDKSNEKREIMDNKELLIIRRKSDKD